MIILREGSVKTRKPHCCWYCEHRIEKGDAAFVQVVKNGPDVGSAYAHEICKRHADQFGEVDPWEGSYYPHETGNLEQIRKEVEEGAKS